MGLKFMGSCRPWELGSQHKNYNLKMRLEMGGKSLALSLPPILVVLLLACGFLSYQLANSEALSLQARQARKIAELQRKNVQLQALMAHKEQERNQMVSLAEARSKELWGELEQRDKEISRLWRIVGEKPGTNNASRLASDSPKKQVFHRGQKPRQPLLGSRHGSRRNALAVKVGYSQLINSFQENEKEMESLSEAAQAYRQRKIDAYKRELASRTPSIWPCKGELSSGFGNRIHPVYGYGRFHGGCDFTTPHGTPIRATAAGVVCHSDWLGGYGKVVEVDHGNGLKTLYAHCSELLVEKGQKVGKGELIAKVGTTGLSSGPHCHYEVRQADKQIDPKPYLTQKDAPKPIANLPGEASVSESTSANIRG